MAIGLLGLVLGPPHAAALLIVPAFVTNVWQFAAGPHCWAAVRRFRSMMLGICVGTALGIGILVGDTDDRATTALGIALIVYAALGLSVVRLHVAPRLETLLALPMGVATGVVSGATGVGVVPSAPFLQALELERDYLIQAMGLSFLVSTAALAVGLADKGFLDAGVAATSLLALVPAGAGMALGQRCRGYVTAETFRRCFFLGLLALGAYLALSGLA